MRFAILGRLCRSGDLPPGDLEGGLDQAATIVWGTAGRQVVSIARKSAVSHATSSLFGRVQGVELVGVASLPGADLRHLFPRDGEGGLELPFASDLVANVAVEPARPGASLGRVPRGGVGTVDPRQDQVQVRQPELAG